MKYLLAFAVAFSATLVWQTSSQADRSFEIKDIAHNGTVKNSGKTTAPTGIRL
ncbi:hypothetical protein [Candidatus Endoriftia persephonae]|jgi:hypothetical protein|uniref:Uncharacterized protein n=3 Tax=Gammaproteobacteria TaxID=1236 RepID=G2FFE7_9GAMM|nr:hypothetical protein [Candidatus Endoriftia persephone]EGW54525.1 hypothetical protein TevJSym_al00590 [endosymbiont of Tevnia jerichonana (vent Tica)]KRT55942.1 hypothetical protein Ga0074115_12751 [endosymbiont of Ridgeia piscesae]KRT57010.1 hypothetical protein Ga0076813_10785 [endosymbiont of Ridgeia piscesae]USF88956.1 hypothetical protein L0Y14_06925 [Candidatus Endoriftia persephone]